MRNLLLIIFIVLLTLGSYAQPEEQTVEENFRATFISPGLEYELPIANKTSILLHLGVGVGGPTKIYPMTGLAGHSWFRRFMIYKCGIITICPSESGKTKM
tara:strand:- start:999 stop:1301 length:303 start_codon:yes stop_codon:yes gene_type:complete